VKWAADHYVAIPLLDDGFPGWHSIPNDLLPLVVGPVIP
jgi:hypothetical protein